MRSKYVGGRHKGGGARAKPIVTEDASNWEVMGGRSSVVILLVCGVFVLPVIPGEFLPS